MIALDASMAAAWLFDDERTADTSRALRRVVEEGAVVPSLWRLEVANVLRNAMRRGRCDIGYVERSLDRLGRLPIETDADTDRQAWGPTWTMARDFGRTLYDAAYLELAARRAVPLATCDRALIEAAPRCGVTTLTA